MYTESSLLCFASCSNSNWKKRTPRKRVRLTPRRPKKAAKPFPFLRLPAELRDYIYELALVDPNGLSLVNKTKALRRTVTQGDILEEHGTGYRSWNFLRRNPHLNHSQTSADQSEDEGPRVHARLSPSLLAVNKQVHAEAVSRLYAQPIALEDTLALHSFLGIIGAANRLELADLTVKSRGHGRGTHHAMNFASMTLLSTCTNLRKLRLDCLIYSGWRTGGPKATAAQLYRDGHCFLEALGTAHGRKDAAIDIVELGKENFSRSGGRQRFVAPVEESEEDECVKRQLRKVLREDFTNELRKLLGCS